MISGHSAMTPPITAKRPYRVALFGAAPDTPNMGVSALFYSAVSGLANCLEDVEFVVFDNGLGRRGDTLNLPSGRTLRLIRFGARGGYRYHRPENIASLLFASRLGKLGGLLNEGIRLIDSCDAVMDVSGGDSFSDIYGKARFNNIFRPKVIVANRKKPLILLPQTYGPYGAPRARELASKAVNGATMAWARDSNSYKILQDLLGIRFDPEIHRCGVDMAFGLPASPANRMLSPSLNGWIMNKTAEAPLLGFNVSGLIYNDPASATKHYRFIADYRKIIIAFLSKILSDTSARIVLISHVMDRPGHFESDLAACEEVFKLIPEQQRNRVSVAPANLDQCQVKWLIGQMSWFCGTRMHSTIAGLSSGVPTVAISYSDKTKGVFDSCDQFDQVFDPRKMDTDRIVIGLWDSYLNRQIILESLLATLPRIRAVASTQMASVADFIRNKASIAPAKM